MTILDIRDFFRKLKIQSLYESKLSSLELPYSEYPVQFSIPEAGEGVFVEIADLYYLVFYERGSEQDRKCATSIDDLVYLLVGIVVDKMASDYALENWSTSGKSQRRCLIEKNIELMFKVSDEYGRRRQNEMQEILRLYPYEQDE